ncbi:50S ribosomal protein L7/L12 [Halarsenatibacter silvermanii]|uniref:Large ribosomal subunit protein bL12 n=1 Tax=Halarsenatibacter silvermanii TaxID=321763 RepID=A0A1G9T6A3_9FIRM|nr:50S ribosomal protein L7/L12 [Halarsenatibacter silvermanii]SDM42625.1 LSU ribosomal protein L12P [Halarsenatibacter silvermanii]
MTKEEIIEAIEEMSVLELSELVEELEDKFGVSAAAPVAAAGAAGGDGGGDGEEEAQSEFDVHLESVGDKKVKVIKAVREITGMGLKDAKSAVDEGGAIQEGMSEKDAEEMKEKLEEAGATVELR